jgi:hypothetical protein
VAVAAVSQAAASGAVAAAVSKFFGVGFRFLLLGPSAWADAVFARGFFHK